MAVGRNYLAEMYRLQGRYDEGRPFLDQALAQAERVYAGVEDVYARKQPLDAEARRVLFGQPKARRHRGRAVDEQPDAIARRERLVIEFAAQVGHGQRGHARRLFARDAK